MSDEGPQLRAAAGRNDPFLDAARSALTLLLPAAAILLGLTAYVVMNVANLGAESYWTDELFSVSQANLDLVGMLKLQGADNHPPLYATVLWVWIRLTHDDSEAMVRVVSLAAIAVGIGALTVVTWRRLGLGTAAIVAVLALTSTLVASFTFEARMHGLAFGLICIATAAWLRLLGEKPLSRRGLFVFVIAGGLASVTQYYAFMTYAFEAGLLGLFLVVTRRRAELGLVAALGVASVVPVLAWLAVTLHLLNPSGTPSLTLSWADDVASYSAQPFTDALFGPAVDNQRGGLGVVFVLVVLGIAALCMVAGLVTAWRRGTGLDPTLLPGVAALVVGIGAIVTGSVESLVAMPTMHYRSVMGFLPPLYVGLGAAATIPFRRLAMPIGLGVSAVLLTLAGVTPPPGQYTKDDWRSAAATIRSARDAGLAADRIAVVEPWSPREWIVELNLAYRRPAPVTDLPAQLAGLRWIAGAPDLTAIPAEGRLLLVAFHFWDFPSHDAIVTTARDRFGACRDQSVTGITILDCAGAAAARQ